MKKALIVIGGLILVIVGAALVIPGFVDWNRYRNQVESTVSSLTGRDIMIGGNLSFRFLPSPQLSAAKVRMANPDGFSSEYFLDLDSLDLEADFLPLLSLDLQVNKIILRGARVNFERNEKGTANWEVLMGGQDREKEGKSDLRFDSFNIVDGEVDYFDAASGTRLEFLDIDAIFSIASTRGPFQGGGSLTYRGERVALQLSLGELFDDRRSPFNLTAVFRGEEPGLNVSGSVLFEDGVPILSGRLEGGGGDLGKLLNAVSRLSGGGQVGGLKFDQPFEIESDIAFGGRRLLAERFDLRVGKTVGGGKLRIDFQEKIEGAANVQINTVVVEDWLQQGAGEGGSGYGLSFPDSLSIELGLEIGAIQYGNGLARQLSLNGMFDRSRLKISQLGVLLPGGATLDFEGDLFGDGRRELLDGLLVFSADNLRATLEWIGTDLSAVPADQLRSLSLRSRLRYSPETIDLISATGRLDITEFNLSVAFGLGARPYYAVNGSIDRFNLSAYVEPQRANETRALEPGWPTWKAKIQDALSPLSEISADFTLVAGQVIYDDLRFEDLDIEGEIRSDVLTLERFSANGVKGIDFEVSGQIGGLGAAPRYDLEIEMRTQNLREVLQAAALTDILDADRLGRARIGGTIEGDLDKSDLNLSIAAAGAMATVKGLVSQSGREPEAIDLALRIEHPDHLDFLQRLDLLEKARGTPMPLFVDLSLKGGKEDMEIGGQFEFLGGRGGMSGSLADPFGAASFNLYLTAGHENLTQLVRGLGLKFNPAAGSLGEFSLAAAFAGARSQFDITGIEAVIGPTRATGALRVDTKGELPRFTGSFNGDRLPLHRFMPKRTAGAEEATLAGGRRWSRNPMELGLLQEVEAEIAFSLGELAYEGYLFRNVSLTAIVRDGVLRVPDLAGQLFEGQVDIAASMDSKGLPAFETSLALSRIRIDDALEAAAAMRPATGRLSLNGEFTARGISQAEMISKLNGRAEMTAVNGVIHGIDVDRLSERLETLETLPDFVALLAAALNGGETPYESISTQVVAEQGILKMDRVAGRIRGATLDGQARIDLPNWNMGATAEMKLLEPADVPPIGVDVTGRVSRPKVEYRTNRIRNYMGLRLATTVFGLRPPGETGEPPAQPQQGGAQPQKETPTPQEEIAKGLFKFLEEAAKRKKDDNGN